MGKDLKGKELGKGICQEKSGFYMARFTDKDGKRRSKRFQKLQECRQWLADAEYTDQHSDIRHADEMFVDEWYNYWIGIKEKTTRPTTVSFYRRRYNQSIKEFLGKFKLTDVKPIHCQQVLNNMADAGYSSTTIRAARIVMRNMFEFACENDILLKNPCKRSIKHNIGKPSRTLDALSVDEQQKFLECGTYLEYFDQFAFILQTGLRIGELIGLEWDDIDFDNKTMTIQRTTNYRSDAKNWYTNLPKSESGIRTVPLTEDAITILARQKAKHWNIKVVPIEWRNKVFLNKMGKPASSTNYDSSLAGFCRKHGMKTFSVHVLRHTFATRCIENGVKPKTLQKILGHSNLSTTMDTYVHITETEKRREIDKVEDALKMVQ